MKGLETKASKLRSQLRAEGRRLKALTRYEGFGNLVEQGCGGCDHCRLKALTRYEGFGNFVPSLMPALTITWVEGTDPL